MVWQTYAWKNEQADRPKWLARIVPRRNGNKSMTLARQPRSRGTGESWRYLTSNKMAGFIL